MDRDTTSWLIPILLAAGVVAAVWYYWSELARREVVAPRVQQPTAEERPVSLPNNWPQHPILDVDNLVGERPDLRPLPPLSNSDEYFKLELTDLFGAPIGALIAKSGLIERVVATVDNLPRDHVAERMRPVSALGSPFVADPVGADLYAISDASYRRYDPLVAIVEASEISELTDLYRRYYPLFQKAYVELGYPDGYFNDRLVEAIDDMLATPEKNVKVMLKRPHVLYEFVNANLESRSSGQKLLLRMGNENAAKIKIRLQSLRDAIASDKVTR